MSFQPGIRRRVRYCDYVDFFLLKNFNVQNGTSRDRRVYIFRDFYTCPCPGTKRHRDFVFVPSNRNTSTYVLHRLQMWMNEYVHIMIISRQNFNDIFFAIFMVRVAARFILCDNRKLRMTILISFEEHFFLFDKLWNGTSCHNISLKFWVCISPIVTGTS